jgi:hypothetical protein
VNRCLAFATAVLAAVACWAGPGITTASADAVLASCPFDGQGFSNTDGIDRGFYVTGFSGIALDDVTLGDAASTPGTYTLKLTARSGTFNGPVIGAPSVTANLPKTSTAHVSFPFFAAPVVMGSTVTFSQTATGPGTVGYDSGSNDIGAHPGVCPNIVQTEGTSPPLDTFRREGVAITVNGLLPNDFTYKVKGKRLLLTVKAPGDASVKAASKKGALLKGSSATGSAPTIAVPLRLTKLGKRKLGDLGKVRAKAIITFTPTGSGNPNTRTAKLKIKKK